MLKPEGIRDPVRDQTVRNGPFTRVVQLHELEGEEITIVFRALDVHLPPPGYAPELEPGDFVVSELVKLLGGKDRLALILHKFFPEAKGAHVRSVGGGWSGSQLCLLFVDGDDQPYFLKFFVRRTEYLGELVKHQQAHQWLGESLVKLKLIEGMEDNVSNQSHAFPETGPGVVCYESASVRKCPRCTLKDIYRKHSESVTTQAFQRCLAILASNQNGRACDDIPWRENGFRLDDRTKAKILATMEDLAPYGPAMCHNDAAQWEACCRTIDGFLHDVQFGWLRNPIPVMLGNTHGDPNPRNCLVLPNNPENIRFIDCGGYEPQGRLVSDLAIIERDIKLVLMGTEVKAGPHFDLDVADMGNWYQAEQESISRGIQYRAEHAPPQHPKKYAPSHRAYQLVGLVRRRAQELSGDWDDQGKHYFAALLFWTLDILKYDAVRPTKKLLAIASAAEILKRF
ncbi:MAG: hypothetical protein ABFE13_12560 [Phycisphaerales bacterium]